MADIYCIRHGQASFATDNYDQLSEIGYRQGTLLGEHLVKAGVRFDYIYAGSLKRQIQTAQQVIEVYQSHDVAIPELVIDPRWNELESEEQVKELAPLVAAQLMASLRAEGNIDDGVGAEQLMSLAMTDKKIFQKLIRATFDLWASLGQGDERLIASTLDSTEGLDQLESWQQAHARVTGALQDVHQANTSGKKTAIFSSGGIIAIIAAHVLKLPSSGVYPLFEKVINCSITRLINNSNEVALSSFNEHAYLNAIAPNAEQSSVITYR